MEIDATLAALVGTLATVVVSLGTTWLSNRAAAQRQLAEERARQLAEDREDKRRAEAKLESEAVRVREVNRAGSGT
ncbi:MAG: hypothetical protein H6722_30695 [Sandaracinus sp.]|nr:hypothetical protein [Myxococcales bacterium]MCB9599549.1 hypothetical protein [Sandaracinus sp.]MCB9616825.1 hypothetical protein [Sandaracinus sp.]